MSTSRVLRTAASSTRDTHSRVRDEQWYVSVAKIQPGQLHSPCALGLGDATIIEKVRIEWRSGLVQELHGVVPKQFLTVTEPARLQALGAGVLRIQSWQGMAFEIQISTDLDQWSTLAAVTNLSGTLEFTDPAAANHLRRFYRTVLK